LNEEARKAAAEGGIMPLDYLLTLLRDTDTDKKTRFDAAVAAAPYVHAKLSSVEQKHSGEIGMKGDPVDRPPRETREEWLDRRKRELGAAALMGTPAGAAE
jgi:hypothetical protein